MEQIEINKEEQEEKLIYDAFRKLLDTYLASNHRKNTDIITRAFQFAKQAHKDASGEVHMERLNIYLVSINQI